MHTTGVILNTQDVAWKNNMKTPQKEINVEK